MSNNLENNYRALLAGLGHDVEREGLRDTPKRYVKFLREFCRPQKFKFTMFDVEGYDEVIIESPIRFASLCEHHCLPFWGVAHIGYLPDTQIAGLSKIPRALKYIASGLQNQERVTTQVADFLMQKLKPRGVAVVLEAEHSCMSFRGANSPGTITTTSCMRGVFKESASTKAEFFALVGKRRVS